MWSALHEHLDSRRRVRALYSSCNVPDEAADKSVDDDVQKHRNAVNDKNCFKWFLTLQNEQIKGTRPKNNCEYVEPPSSVKWIMIKQIEPDHQQDGGDEKTDAAEADQEFAFHRTSPY